MGYHCRGEIEIPLEDWVEFVEQYVPGDEAMTSFGSPTIHEAEEYISVPFALNTQCHPQDEACPPSWTVD